jgi:hypothetical protein
MTRNAEYDVALSFAGEDRLYVELVAEQLTARGISVFYDRYEQADLWGKDLYTHLTEVYRSKAKYTLMFISKHYRERIWTNHEMRAAQSRALEESREYILPARFDDTEIPGILPTTFYIDLRNNSPVQVALLVTEKLGRDPLTAKAHSVPSPKNASMQGEAHFNYSNHNGRFRIGEGHFEFETCWSKASNMRIHCYADSPRVRAVALVPKGATLNSIPPAEKLDFTSRVRTPDLGRFMVLQNDKGMYAALQILEIKDDTRGDAEDLLRFRYWILTDGSSDFSPVEEP